MDTERSSQQTPSTTCVSCHVISISAASILGIYMFHTAKKAQSTTHRFTCALFGLGMRKTTVYFLCVKKDSSYQEESKDFEMIV